MAEISFNSLVSNEASVAVVDVAISGYHGAFTGVSKKHPKDRHVASVGEALATARAFREAADDLEEWAVQRNTMHQRFVKDLEEAVGE